VVDTLRADHLPAYGYGAIQTPHLDAFAKDAIRFDQAFSNASWTRPSFASLMTGRYPSSHNTMQKSDSLPDGLVTLAEAMQQGGYTTLGVVTNYNVAPFFNFQQGFDEYRYLTPDFVLGASDTAAKLLFVQALRNAVEGFKARRGLVEPNTAYRDGKEVNAAVLRLIDAHRDEGPLYTFVGYMDPHDPYYPHPYDGTGYSRAAHQQPGPEEAPLLTKLYDGEIRYWDEVFGELVAELKKRKLDDDTTIVVTADHGEEFMEHGGFWHGTTLYDEQVRVPLFLKLPGREGAGSVRSNWVQSIDLMPSLLTRAGLAVPAGVQGKDLMQDTERLLAEEDHEGNQLRALRMRRSGQALKLIEANQGNPRGLEPYELFQLDQDPKELVNLAKQEAELVTYAASELERQHAAARQGGVAKSEVNLTADANAVERLRSLGYAGGETKTAATHKPD
jgi:arylsulfatase A-like enzyme